LCKSIFHIPAQNRAKHFSPYIARSLAVLSEQKEERAFSVFGLNFPNPPKEGLPMKKVLTVTMDGMHAWQTCRSPNAAMRQRWQHSPLTPSWMLCMAPGFTAAFARPGWLPVR